MSKRVLYSLFFWAQILALQSCYKNESLYQQPQSLTSTPSTTTVSGSGGGLSKGVEEFYAKANPVASPVEKIQEQKQKCQKDSSNDKHKGPRKEDPKYQYWAIIYKKNYSKHSTLDVDGFNQGEKRRVDEAYFKDILSLLIYLCDEDRNALLVKAQVLRVNNNLGDAISSVLAHSKSEDIRRDPRFVSTGVRLLSCETRKEIPLLDDPKKSGECDDHEFSGCRSPSEED